MLAAAAAASASLASPSSASVTTTSLPPLNSSLIIDDDEKGFSVQFAAVADAVRVSQELARDVLQDVAAEFSSLAAVWKHFADWKESYPTQ